MFVGLVFALLAVLCGVAVNRAARAPLSLAPLSGLAAVAALTTWGATLGLPPVMRTGGVVLFAAFGLVISSRDVRGGFATVRRNARAIALLAVAVALPTLILGVAFATLDTPLSTHDGAFHVEAIDSLRRGAPLDTWYPMGFHASVAAVLGLLPWIDTAQGTFQAAQGLAILAPLAAFSLASALGLEPLVGAIAAVVLALSWTYPYDYHLWDGWPQGMGILLLAGLCATALEWLRRPSARTAALGGLFAGAILLSHGTEVYSAVLVLGVLAVARRRSLASRRLAAHLLLAAGVALLITGPYVSVLLGWARSGGATSFGQTAAIEADGQADWLQLLVGVTGAGSLIDLPVRVALIAFGITRSRGTRLAGAVWLAVVGLLLVMDYVDLPPLKALFVVTYPWLDHDRPMQVAAVFASLLAAGGIATGLSRVRNLRQKFAAHPNAIRRVAVAGALALFFVAEGSGVSIYKRLTQAIIEQNVYSADDAAAMKWLEVHAGRDDVLANDLAGDAGIWAPYKAGVPILLPRSASGSLLEDREPILQNVLNLSSDPGLEAKACALHVNYLFHGAPPAAFDERMLQDADALARAPGLEEVFSSGDAAIYRLNLPCN